METTANYDAGMDDDIIDFDGEIENDNNEFTVLPEGDTVIFEVTDLERGFNKDGRTPHVKVGLKCKSVNGHGTALITEFLTMNRKSEWKLCEFFRSIGLRKHGERLRMHWEIIGCTGHAKVKQEKWTGKNGDVRTDNRIKSFLDPATVDDDEAVSFE